MKLRLLILVLICRTPTISYAQDEITYIDRTAKKESKVSGVIQAESPNGITIKVGGNTIRDIAAMEVIDVVYDVSATFRVEYRNAMARLLAGERATTDDVRNKELADAKTRLEKLRESARDEKAKRQIEFKLVELAAMLSQGDAGITPLSAFRQAHPQAWQTGRVVDRLALLYSGKGDHDAAIRIRQEFADTPNLAREIRLDAELKVARLLLDAGKPDLAESKLKKLAGEGASDSALGVHLQVLLAACLTASGKGDEAVKKLETLLEQVADPDLKAVTFNALGDCHRLANRPREAMWCYLWVDVIYHADRREHARALYHLVTLFTQFKDEKRAAEFREKLAGPAFAGIEFQKKMIAGK